MGSIVGKLTWLIETAAWRKRPLGLCALAAALAMPMAFSGGPATAADCGSSAAPGLDWRDCSKRSIVIPGSDLQGADLFSTDFTMTDLSGSNLTGANLEKASLMRASLAGAQAGKANFSRIEAYRTNFSGISAEGASFAAAELQRADFTGAKLTGGNFEKAELGRANFDNAVLTGAKFSFANLSRADLSSATFEGPIVLDHAFMFLTRIEGLDLSAATGLEQAQVNLACGNEQTKLPAGLAAPDGWPCASD
jgi:uncharacterized protein YjbI with pentapeptide repeats